MQGGAPYILRTPKVSDNRAYGYNYWINGYILQGTVIKIILDTPLSGGSGGQEPNRDFFSGYFIFYLAIYGAYCIH